jgi:hypothetical protein
LPADEGGCMNWTASLRNGRYGSFEYRGQSVQAHRFSYELSVSPVPTGCVLDHKCGNSRCVRPDHLEAVTQQINVLRGSAPTSRNANAVACVHGHAFTEDNTYRRVRNGRPVRDCVTCARRRARGEAAA